MHFAAATGQLTCLKYLVEANGNADTRDANGATPLYFAAQEGHTECVRWLAKHAKADPLAKARGSLVFLWHLCGILIRVTTPRFWSVCTLPWPLLHECGSQRTLFPHEPSPGEPQ
jgi:hypothetical protein